VNDAEKAAWLQSRSGKLTASRMADAMDMLKSGKPGAARVRLMHELLAERMTGDSVPHFVNSFMQWGLEQEPAAKNAYEMQTGKLLTACGFIEHPTIPDFGSTPDALMPGEVAEFKCPQTVTHIGWMLAGGVPAQHKPQILAQLACTGREHAVFVSYDPRVRNAARQLYIAEWTPAKSEIEAVEEAARMFLAELDVMWTQLTEKEEA
jgi:putative phage-type endonuclease